MSQSKGDKWWKPQETTFTRWVNSSLRGHLTSSRSKINNLSTDLTDGRILGELLECIAKKKVNYMKEDKQLKFKPQKLENLGVSFRFMEKEQIKLVNIGPEDIFSGNLKLIMGLIWTLIGRYQIRSTGRALSTKNAMLAWVNTQIPEMNIRNFTKDWNDGVAICALVNRIRPGLIPHYATLNRSDKLKNCSLGMGLAEEKLDIPKMLEPEDFSHPDVDELSVMTYISFFCEPANAHLLKWVQATIPKCNIKNFTTDWNDGINLGHLLEALNPGGFPNCNKLDPHNAEDNLAQGMKMAEEQLGIKPVLKPSQMADPKVDELNIVTYLSRFQNAKPLPQPQAILCSGDGLRKAVIGQTAVFEVDASKGGSGDLEVDVTCSGKPVANKINKNLGKNAIFTINYTPESAGKLSIAIKWSGMEVPTSPYVVNVIDPKTVSLSSPYISGEKCGRVGKQVKMELKGVADTSDIEVMIQFPTGHSEEAKLGSKSKGVAECSYTPRVVGTDKVTAKVAGISIPGSPFSVKVVDPKVLNVMLRDPIPGAPLMISEKATIVVSAAEGKVEGVSAELVSSSGSTSIPLRAEGASSVIGVTTPVNVGKHEIIVTCDGEDIKGSPLSLQVFDPSKCILDDIPKFLHVGDPFNARLSAQNVGDGFAQAKSSDIGVLGVECKEISGKNYDIKLVPKKVGASSVSVDWNGHAVPKTPHGLCVCDAMKCNAFGAGLIEGKSKIKEPFEFTVQTVGAGMGELSILPKGPKSSPAANIVKTSDGKYNVNFTTFEVGDHTIDIRWSGKAIPSSPYVVNFYKAAAAGSFTATGDGLKTAVAKTTAKFMIAGPESGLLSQKILNISIGNSSTKSAMVSKAEFKPESNKAMVFAADSGNGAYAIDYAVPSAGKYTLSVTSDGESIPGSPFAVDVLPAPEAGKCVALGPAIDSPSTLLVQNPLEFKVDSTEAGTGVLAVTCKDPKGATITVFLAEDKASQGKRIHSIKIDLTSQGKHEVNVMWSGKGIPKSPFHFNAGDPKEVTIVDLADSAEYVGRKGEPITFSVDTRKAGVGEVKGAAKLEDGKVEPFTQKKNRDGTVKLSMTPTKVGKLELLLTFSGANILPAPWIVEVTDPSAFKVIPPKDPCKVNEYVKFIISGLKKKQAKNVAITAKNKTHNATVKLEFTDQGQAVPRFTAKEIGTYDVVVQMAKNDVPGSPFKCSVVNPEGCIISGDVPTIIPIGVEKQFIVDTAKAGPGDLTLECTDLLHGSTSLGLICTISAGEKKAVNMMGKVCGKSSFDLKFAGFSIPSMPVEVVVTDPIKCSFTCEGIVNNSCKTDGSITVDVDTTEGGNCTPEVTIKGPKSNYDIELKRITEGRYRTKLTPWQDGKNKLHVTVGRIDVPNSPMNFDSRKPLDVDKVTVSGPGLTGAVANRRAEVTIYARESMLVDNGALSVAFKDNSVRDFEVYDKMNGTYNVSFTPKQTGSVTLCVTGDGKDVGGSPFNINVVPEPDPSKCRIQNRSGDEVFGDSSSIHHPVRTPFELGVVTTGAGSGKLVAAGQAPNKSQIRVFTNDERSNGDSITYIKFDPSFIGIYTLSLTWDGKKMMGSPYSIKVVDPSKCISSESFPSYIKLGDKADYEIDASSAGEGDLEVFMKGSEAEATVMKTDAGVWTASIRGLILGSTSVDIKYGGFTVGAAPYTLTVCDPTKCKADFVPGIYNLNKPVKFTVTAEGAGRAKLQVVSSKKGFSMTKNTQEATWGVTFTPKEIGEHHLRVLWGEWDIGGSPYTIMVCDPGRVKIEGLPDPNDILPMNDPVVFTVDTTEAGTGNLTCHILSDEGIAEDVSRDETDGITGITSMQFVPKGPGKIQLVLEFNGMDILPKPHVYDVPDPSQFQVTPPKGYGRVKEYIKFSVTGASEDTQLSITASHTAHNATVKTERGTESKTIIARMTPKEIGDYQVEVKHADQHINGSPFTIQVCDPDLCQFVGEVPTVIHVGVEPNIQVDTSQAGPGKLTFEAEVLSGMEKTSTTSEDKVKWVLAMEEGVGKIRVVVRYGGYNIPNSPLSMTLVDSQIVSWSCEVLDTKNLLMQGETIKILVDGREAGEAVPEVIARGPEADYPVKIADNEDGTYTVALNVWQIGANEVTLLWGGMAIPEMPIAFEVTKGVESRAIALSGDGLDGATSLCEAVIMINALEPGLVERGLLLAKFEGDEEEELPTYKVSDEGMGKYRLTFVAPNVDVYTLSITYEGNHIPMSPLDIKVSAPPDAGKCRVFGEAMEKVPGLFVADDPVKFSVDTSEAGKSSLSISASRPDDEPMYVYTVEEGGVHHLKFDPVLIGHHSVQMKWGGIDIPGSPFSFNVVDPTKCTVQGAPQQGSHHVPEEPIDFSVLVTGVGECSPEVSATVKGETIDLKCTEASEGSFSYSYMPKTFGRTSISVKVAGDDVPKSPFKFVVVDPNIFSISGNSLQGDYAIVCEPVTIEITGQGSEDDDLLVTAHGPSADLSVQAVERSDVLHTATFVPIEPGSYELFVECGGSHVNGSPTSIKVADPSKCQLLGDMIFMLQVNEMDEITVKTRGAGEGELKVIVKHEDDAFPVLDCEVNDIGLDTYTVSFTGKEIGKAAIDIQWGGFSIPSSPFLLNVCDASLCRAHGEVIETGKGKAGSPIKFLVETADAGEGELEVTAKGPSAQYTVNISELMESTYEVTFTPWEVGNHSVQVLWGKGNIRNSPFTINVGSPLEMEVCNATGDGLKHAIASQKATFMILCSEVGMLDKDALKVNVMGVTTHAKVVISDNNNGSYTVDYIPPIPGVMATLR